MDSRGRTHHRRKKSRRRVYKRGKPPRHSPNHRESNVRGPLHLQTYFHRRARLHRAYFETAFGLRSQKHNTKTRWELPALLATEKFPPNGREYHLVPHPCHFP